MKKIVCDLCDGMEFVKEGGMFVCQGCGTKYSPEEAKGMMREMDDGDAPAAPANSAPAGNPNQAQVENLMVLARNAYEADKNDETIGYCNKAIELDAKCSEAWLLKGMASGWQTTLKEPRLSEAALSFCNAIDYAPEEEKEATKRKAFSQMDKMSTGFVNLRCDMFKKYEDEEETNAFLSDLDVAENAFNIMKNRGYDTGMSEGHRNLVALKMAEAGMNGAKARMILEVMQKTDELDRKMKGSPHYSPKEYEKFWAKRYYDFAVIEKAIALRGEKVDDTLESMYVILIDVGKFLCEGEGLRDNNNKLRYKASIPYRKAKKRLPELQAELAEIKKEEERKAEEERLAKIKAYWDAHPEEKAARENEKKELDEKASKLKAFLDESEQKINTIKADAEAKKKPLQEQIEAADKNLADAQLRKSEKVAAEKEIDETKKQIDELTAKRNALGLFAGKEKKQLAAQIAELEAKLPGLTARIPGEKQALEAEVKEITAKAESEKNDLQARCTAIDEQAAAKIAPIEAEMKQPDKELGDAYRRIREIEDELSKIPEE